MLSPFQNASPADLLAGVREGTYSDRETDALAACVLAGEWVQLPDTPSYRSKDGWIKAVKYYEGHFRGWFYINHITEDWKICGPLLVEYRHYEPDVGYCSSITPEQNAEWGEGFWCCCFKISDEPEYVRVFGPNPCRAIVDAALMVELGKWVEKGEA